MLFHCPIFVIVLSMTEGGFLLLELLAALAVDVQSCSRCITCWNIVRHLLHSTAKAHSAAHKITAVIEIHAQRQIFFLFVPVLALRFGILHGKLYELQLGKLNLGEANDADDSAKSDDKRAMPRTVPELDE